MWHKRHTYIFCVFLIWHHFPFPKPCTQTIVCMYVFFVPRIVSQNSFILVSVHADALCGLFANCTVLKCILWLYSHPQYASHIILLTCPCKCHNFVCMMCLIVLTVLIVGDDRNIVKRFVAGQELLM